MEYKLLDKQIEFMSIPHNQELDVAIYQGGYGSGKTWCGSGKKFKHCCGGLL